MSFPDSNEIFSEARSVIDKIKSMKPKWELDEFNGQWQHSNEFAIKCTTSNGYKIRLQTYFWRTASIGSWDNGQRSEIQIIGPNGEKIYEREFNGAVSWNKEASEFIQEYVEEYGPSLREEFRKRSRKAGEIAERERKRALNEFLDS